VRIVVALVLAIAAGLKAHQLVSGSATRTGAGDPSWLAGVTVGIEAGFALWLLSNVRPFLARRATIVLLTVLALVSLYRLLAGETSCGCFGTFAVHPGWTLALDVLLLALCYGATADGASGGIDPREGPRKQSADGHVPGGGRSSAGLQV
jgi:hypothetical protein